MIAATSSGHPALDRWNDFVNEIAPGFKVPPNLVKAHMLYESGGDPKVVSADGGCGLCQITSSVKALPGGKYTYFGADILEPYYNLQVACRDFIAPNLRAFPDNLDAAIAAYNAGAGAVQAALNNGRPLTEVTYDPMYIPHVSGAYAWLCAQSHKVLAK